MDNRSRLSYAELVGTANAVILGEVSHSNLSFQKEVVRSLKELKKAGFTHLGLEMLSTDLNINNQRAVIEHVSTYYYAGHAIVINEAFRLNIELVALDMPYNQQLTYSDDETLYTQRNYWMARSAQKIIKQGKKLIIYMHYGHSINGTAEHNIPDKNGVQTILKREGINTINIKLVGGAWGNAKSKVCSSQGRLPTAIKAQKDRVQNTLFSVAGDLGVDHIIHIPQNCVM